jgi:pimeloyl-ACP methyl ester carboxylesterase
MSRRTAAVLALAALAVSCSLERLRRDDTAKNEMGLLAGAVVTPSGSTGNVVAALFSVEGGVPRIEGCDRLSDLVRSFAFLVAAGRPHVVVAFQDLDGNLAWDPGEPVGTLRDGATVTVAPRQVLSALETRLQAGATPPSGLELDLRGVPAEDGSDLRLALGEVASLDEPRFDPERGEDAMWASLAAMRSTGFGLYLLQPYDPQRIPVVFIHGIAGTPRDLKDVIAGLDTSRFQAWVFQYPSGLRLAYSAEMLARALERLHESLGFGEMVVVAHSMGGLVARGALQWLDGRTGAGFVSTFVTFATPWLGHESAASGLKWLSAPVPAWIDMVPESDYLRSLRQPLPEGIAYHLLFAFGGGRSLIMGEANDGVATVVSQLAPFAQEEATRVWGYDLDHMTILSDRAPLARFAGILAAVAAEGRREGK